ncbi:T6SS immunity protein Tdi1 domain-containing protein [Microbacterium sp. P01]|uniref:T6SS immunity protein Tdi1 domain-containing protein n=1 Tax=Microbacterium sp. P01 TaxID=3366261 RepID=UPI003673015D
MSVFTQVTPLAPIAASTIDARVGRVPDEIIEAWREHGAGYLGDDGFVRLIDPDRADTMLEGVIGFPEGATVVFATGLGDLIAYVAGRWWVVLFRWGTIDVTEVDVTDAFLSMIQSDAGQDRVLERQPYPAAAMREHIPGVDQCFGFVPLLALGGPPTADHLQLGGLWEHIALIVQLAGPPQPRGQLAL